MNPSLAMVLEKARHANMPKANIERAIARAADKSAAALIEEVYEAYGPGGVGIVIEVATDNKTVLCRKYDILLIKMVAEWLMQAR